jgi:hypothetical protein
MSLNAQAIAVSGYGFGAQMIAVIGYAETGIIPEPEFTGGSFARVVKAKKKKRRNVEEDEVLMFMM